MVSFQFALMKLLMLHHPLDCQFFGYFIGNEIYEELLGLETLFSNTTAKNIYDIVVKMFNERQINILKIVLVTTDGAPNMVGRNVGFAKLFTEVLTIAFYPFTASYTKKFCMLKLG